MSGWQFPKGPWVLVVGMHRSGTSAIAGAIGALGMSLPRIEDRIGPRPSNPEHWESESIMFHNDEVLDRLGGSWAAPPDLQPGWVESSQLAGLGDPAPLFSRAFPDSGPLVWKDPRACLLLPYWRTLIPEPVAAVFIWRSPIAVARSLRKRDGFSLVHGLSLWERYNRAALEGLEGLDVFVFAYEDLMQDHRRTVGSVAAWLGSLDQFAPQSELWNVDKAVSSVSDELLHQTIDPAADGLLLAEHRSMIALLADLDGGHRQFDPGSLPVESAWAEEVLADRREARLANRRESELWEKIDDRVQRVNMLEDELTDLLESLHAAERDLDWMTRVVAGMEASTSWRMTSPFRSMSAKVRGHGGASHGTSG